MAQIGPLHLGFPVIFAPADQLHHNLALLCDVKGALQGEQAQIRHFGFVGDSGVTGIVAGPGETGAEKAVEANAGVFRGVQLLLHGIQLLLHALEGVLGTLCQSRGRGNGERQGRCSKQFFHQEFPFSGVLLKRGTARPRSASHY